RYLGTTARVEVAAAELGRLEDARIRDEVRRGVSAAGFEEVLFAEAALRSGSLNDALAEAAPPESRRLPA
ncbi:MAG: ATP-binding protein, partial [Candidatus Binatia bacterium]